MKENLNEIHAEIAEMQMHNHDGTIKSSLGEIPEITHKDWETLRQKLFSGEILVKEFSISPASFQLLAAPGDRAGFMIFNSLAFLVPLAAFILAVVYSWWFIFLSLGFFVMLRTAKSFYRTVIFQGVTASEAVFCFLFSRKTICLQQNGNLIYKKND